MAYNMYIYIYIYTIYTYLLLAYLQYISKVGAYAVWPTTIHIRLLVYPYLLQYIVGIYGRIILLYYYL